jgi:hypothetical protein
MLAASLKQDFRPFLPQMMEQLVKDMKRDIDLKIVEASQAEIEDDDEEKNPSLQKIAISIKGVEGAKTIQMNTTALENKIDAIVNCTQHEPFHSYFQSLPKIRLDVSDHRNEENIEKFNELWIKFMNTINDIVSYEYLIDNKILSDFYTKFNILQNKIKELLNTRISKALILLETKIKNKNNSININKLEQEFKDCNNIISKYQYLISESMLDNFKEGYKLLQYKIKNFKLENNKRKQNIELKTNISLIKSNNLNKKNKKKQPQRMNLPIRRQRPFMPYQQREIITH